ncbi:MAG: hypothetical protein IPO71_14430 [Nitrosomonas sp.]|nr:hypothetical protein [Nitrosomonas sp.]
MQEITQITPILFALLAVEAVPEGAVFNDAEFMAWHARWQERLSRQSESKLMSFRLMRRTIRQWYSANHRVEEALSATEHGDYSLIHRLLAAGDQSIC